MSVFHQRAIIARVARVAAAAVVAAAMLVAAAPRTAAAVNDWHGADPNGTVCNRDARTVKSAAITFKGHRLGAIELRYSPTCKTAWARLTNDMDHVPGDAHSGYGQIHRNSDGASFTCWSPAGPRTVCWTRMVNDNGVTSFAYGNIDPYPTYGYGTAEARTGNYRTA